MSKNDRRKELASRSFSEKIKILEKLRDRSRAIAASGPRRRRVSLAGPVPSRARERYQ
jgi:hypothetical protein